MPELPFVSIIVVNWNGEVYIEKCIQSLLSMAYQNFEIIVIDNNSTDSSIKILKRLNQNPKIKVIFNKKNLGFSKACNIGIRASKSKFIGLFNNDAIAGENWLGELVNAIQKLNQVGAASGPIYFLNPPNKIWFAGGKVDSVTGFIWYNDQYNQYTRNNLEIDALSGCAILIKREILNKLGLLDEGYFLYGEDVDLSFSIRRLEKKLLFVPTAISWHRVSACKEKAYNFVYELKQYSELRLILKNFSLKLLPITLFFRFLLLPIAESIYFNKNPKIIINNVNISLRMLKQLKQVFIIRGKINLVGKLTLENRFKEAVQEAKGRIKEKQLHW